MLDRFYSPSLKGIVIAKVIWTHFRSKKLFHNLWCNVIFNFEVTRACILLWCIETKLSLFSRSWNDSMIQWLSRHVILNALSCKEAILSLRHLLAKTQDTCMEQLLLMRWIFDLHLYRGCLCDLQKRVLNSKLYLVVHSFFQIW